MSSRSDVAAMPADLDPAEVRKAFRAAYGRDPEALWSAPGRINLIGEHTDYNDGWVLPLAASRRTVAAAAQRNDGLLACRSLQQPAADATVALDSLVPGSVSGWAAYPAGVAWALSEEKVPIGGVDLLVSSDLPIGGGVSSSAALECAVACAFDELFGSSLDRPQLASLARRAEADFVGVPCGIMDQLAVMLCAREQGLLIDTRNLSTEAVPLELANSGLALLVVDTRHPHSLTDGRYAVRRGECDEAAAVLGVAALRDVGLPDLEAAVARLAEPLGRRVRHVVTENARVQLVAELLRSGGIRKIGPLLSQSHVSLRDDYEVTTPELDTAVASALRAGAFGARMVGAGFGGSAIALVSRNSVERVADAVADAFAAHGLDAPAIWLSEPADGAGPLQASGA